MIKGEMHLYKLLQGDCLEVMKNIPDKSVDMILCDLPYTFNGGGENHSKQLGCSY